MLALLAGLCPGAAAAEENAAAERAELELTVVVHPGVPVDDLSFAELRKFLLGDRQFWPSGPRVTLLVHSPPSPERELLLEKVYKMTEAQFHQYWIAKVFRTEASSGPKIVLSNDMALGLVTAIPGALALVRAEEVPAGVKVLKVDGLSPGEPDYPLR